MTRTRKRKIKSMIAEIIACTLIAIATAVIGLVLIKLAILTVVSTNLTYEEFRQAMAIISIVVAIIAVMKLLKEPKRVSRMDKYDEIYIWHIIMQAKMKLKFKELREVV